MSTTPPTQAATNASHGTNVGFVGVHIGAGQHSETRTPVYLSICSRACQVAVDMLRKGASAVEAATAATVFLEDQGETNAGFGSNLTEIGTVEMDAGIMNGANLLFGAVGAVPGIKNPIMVAKRLMDEQNKGLLPLGRVPPMFMVGEGARDWAKRHGITPVENESELISEKSGKLYKYYKKKLDNFNHVVETMGKQAKSRMPHNSVPPQPHEDEPAAKKMRFLSNGQEEGKKEDWANPNGEKEAIAVVDDNVNDTVGVTVLDLHGNVASTVSSGGIALKQPGRVGQVIVNF